MNKYIEVFLPEDAKSLNVHYQKVAEREEFNVEDAEELLQKEITYQNVIKVENEDAIQIADLEDGIYKIDVIGNQEYEFAPMLVSMPAWETEGEQLLYEVCVTPKYTKIVKPEPEQTTLTETQILESPKTGDGTLGGMYGVFVIISFVIVLIMSCHNRFKCARMSE